VQKSDTPTEHLLAARKQFVQFWGEMSSSWGISRTMSQVFALLYVSDIPLDTDTLMDELDISRGNANMNLHKLMNWGLVRKVEQGEHSRKDHFVAEQDVWRMTLNIIRNRQARELEPVRHRLTELADDLLQDANGQPRTPTAQEEAFRQHLHRMADFMHLFGEVTAVLLPLLEAQDPQHLQELIGLLRPNPEANGG
jgi:DNA-binding transcriptional regulator GbsR (MarR family)